MSQFTAGDAYAIAFILGASFLWNPWCLIGLLFGFVALVALEFAP
jgi:hypothetical protein